MHADREARPQLPSLDGATVERISVGDAKAIILKYEWLQSMGSGTIACYGLKLAGEILGVVCFGSMGANIRNICVGATADETKLLAEKTVCLQRGACVPWAPKNAASFLIRHACRKAYAEFGWRIFFAYADANAGEVGTVYQAANWFSLGAGSGRRAGAYHSAYVSPDGKTTLSSYRMNHSRKALMKKYGCPRFTIENGKRVETEFRPWLRQHGWKQRKKFSDNTSKYVWFEGNTVRERENLKSLCRFVIVPHTPRMIDCQHCNSAKSARKQSSAGIQRRNRYVCDRCQRVTTTPLIRVAFRAS
jgi:hypothetical protein